MGMTETLKGLRDELTVKQDAIEVGLATARAKREALVAQVQPIEAELRIVNAEIKAGEVPLHDIGNQLAEIARVLGAKTLRNG